MRFRYSIDAALVMTVIGFLVCLSAINSAARAQSAPAPQVEAISPETSDAIARMGKTLEAKAFSFLSRTTRAYAGPNGELLHISHATKIVVRRPDRLLADMNGDDGSTKMIYDGKDLVIYGAEQNKYVTIPATGDVQKMLEVTEEKMGVDFPLADLVSNNPGVSLLAGVTSGGQVGTATIDGVRSRHFFFAQSPDLDMELWLEDNDRSLPRRLFITYKSLPGRPTFMADLSNWDFSINPADADFVFRPPAGAQQVAAKPKWAPPTVTGK